jgi:hypothetical protein
LCKRRCGTCPVCEDEASLVKRPRPRPSRAHKSACLAAASSKRRPRSTGVQWALISRRRSAISLVRSISIGRSRTEEDLMIGSLLRQFWSRLAIVSKRGANHP